MYVESDQQAVILPDHVVHNLREVGRHLSDYQDREIDDPRIEATRIFVGSYLDQFADDFAVDEDRAIYKGTAGVSDD